MLTGEIKGDIKEGSLLPETYHFVYGDKRQDVIDRMEAAMTTQLGTLWQHRKQGLPFETPQAADIDPSVFSILQPDYIRKRMVLPIRREGKRVVI